MSAPVERLREASRLMRERATDKFTLAVADWLDAEADTQEGFEPFIKVINQAYKNGSGDPTAHLTLGVTESGEMQFRSNTLPAALATANAYLRSES